MLLYQVNDIVEEITPEKIDPNILTVGVVSCEELVKYGKDWGFNEESILASQKINPYFRTSVDVFENYTFSQLKVVDQNGDEDHVSIFVKKNFLLIVDITDEDESTIACSLRALQKYPANRISLEKLILWFIEALLADSTMVAEEIRNSLSLMEEQIVNDKTGEHFNVELLEIKKLILKYYNYYEQILDIVDTLEENENEVLNPDNIKYISILSNRISRLSEDMSQLTSTAEYIQGSYTSLLDQRMNNTMKVLTIITTIFTPLTVIVGWYGMNFENMPELSWKYGYLLVTIFSVLIVVLMVVIGKKKRWF